MRWRRRVKPARPYICLLIIFVLLLTPSVRPLWYGSVTAAVAACDVEVEAAGEGVQMGQVGGAGVGDPLPELVLVAGVGGRAWRRRSGSGWPGLSSPGRRRRAVRASRAARPVRLSGLVSRIRVALRGDEVRPVGVGAALVDVADQQVGAARVAALADLPQQLLDRDPGFLGSALAQVVAVGVDEGGPVLRVRGAAARARSARS